MTSNNWTNEMFKRKAIRKTELKKKMATKTESTKKKRNEQRKI